MRSDNKKRRMKTVLCFSVLLAVVLTAARFYLLFHHFDFNTHLYSAPSPYMALFYAVLAASILFLLFSRFFYSLDFQTAFPSDQERNGYCLRASVRFYKVGGILDMTLSLLLAFLLLSLGILSLYQVTPGAAAYLRVVFSLLSALYFFLYALKDRFAGSLSAALLALSPVVYLTVELMSQFTQISNKAYSKTYIVALAAGLSAVFYLLNEAKFNLRSPALFRFAKFYSFALLSFMLLFLWTVPDIAMVILKRSVIPVSEALLLFLYFVLGIYCLSKAIHALRAVSAKEEI